MPPNRDPMVATSRWKNQVRIEQAATARSMPGHCGRQRRNPTTSAIVSAAIVAAAGRAVSIDAQSAPSLGKSGAGSFATSSPSSSLIWLAKMITAMPLVKPTVTG